MSPICFFLLYYWRQHRAWAARESTDIGGRLSQRNKGYFHPRDEGTNRSRQESFSNDITLEDGPSLACHLALCKVLVATGELVTWRFEITTRAPQAGAPAVSASYADGIKTFGALICLALPSKLADDASSLPGERNDHALALHGRALPGHPCSQVGIVHRDWTAYPHRIFGVAWTGRGRDAFEPDLTAAQSRPGSFVRLPLAALLYLRH